MDLRSLYLATLERCAPEQLVKRCVTADMPHNVVAIGKCAGPLLDGVAAIHPVRSAFAAIPSGYVAPRTPAEVHFGGHPRMTRESFEAGRALLAWVDAHDDVLFLVSGGGSACVEAPLAPFTEEQVAKRNADLIARALPIGAINAARREVSAIKGGRLRERVRGRNVTLVWSDVSTGALNDVASGPTIGRPEDAILVADNTTLTAAAAEISGAARIDSQIECGVQEAAELLADRAQLLRSGQVLAAGGEPVVEVLGDGRGGRCCELAVRFWLEWGRRAAMPRLRALFGSSDGVDGNSGLAAVELRLPAPGDAEEARRSLARSDSAAVAGRIGRAIMIPPTGNNLRDLFLVARD